MNVLNVSRQQNLRWDNKTYEVSEQLNRCIKRLERKINEQFSSSASHIAVSAEKMIADLDQMLQKFQQITQHIRRLQILRAWLCNENSDLICNLLTKESYQQYDETDLDLLVKQFFVQHHTISI